MLVIFIHLGPTVLARSSFTVLAFLSNGCLAFRLVSGPPQYCTVDVWVLFVRRHLLLSTQPHSSNDCL